jgi:hypothetical protein
VQRAKFPYYTPFPNDMPEHDRAAIAHTTAFMNCAMMSEECYVYS